MGLDEEILRQYLMHVHRVGVSENKVYATMFDRADKTEVYNAVFELDGLLKLGVEKIEDDDHLEYIIYKTSSGGTKLRLEKAKPRKLTEEDHKKLEELGR